MFYYSIKLALGNEMEQNLKKEAIEAYSCYEKQKSESSITHSSYVVVDNSSHLKEREKEESGPSLSPIISTGINVPITHESEMAAEQFLAMVSATPSAPKQKNPSLDEGLEPTRDNQPKFKKLKQPTLMEMGLQLNTLEQNIVSQPEPEATTLDTTTTSEQDSSLSFFKEEKELKNEGQQTSSSNTTETSHQDNPRSQSSSKGPAPS